MNPHSETVIRLPRECIRPAQIGVKVSYLGGSPSEGDRLSVVSDVVGDSRDAGVADGSGLRGAVAQEQDGHVVRLLGPVEVGVALDVLDAQPGAADEAAAGGAAHGQLQGRGHGQSGKYLEKYKLQIV